jgi:hypothetical protein
MNPAEGNEPLSDDEIVYRRVSDKSGWYQPASERPIAWVAFKPNSYDLTGLSVWRAKYLTAEQAAEHQKPNKRFYILSLNVGRLRQAGVDVVSSVKEGGIGHASLITLNYTDYQHDTIQKNRLRELAERIAAELVERVDGPFGPFESPEPSPSS